MIGGDGEEEKGILFRFHLNRFSDAMLFKKIYNKSPLARIVVANFHLSILFIFFERNSDLDFSFTHKENNLFSRSSDF